MKKIEYIVKYGFKDNEKVIIGSDELEKALYIHKYDDVAVLGGKQVSGSNIIVIEPYRIKIERTATVDGNPHHYVDSEYEKLDEAFEELRQTRGKIDLLIRTGRKNLIGTNAELLESGQLKLE